MTFKSSGVTFVCSSQGLQIIHIQVIREYEISQVALYKPRFLMLHFSACLLTRCQGLVLKHNPEVKSDDQLAGITSLIAEIQYRYSQPTTTFYN